MKTIKIKGMRCDHCVRATAKALEDIEGVTRVRVDLDKGEASFEGDVSMDTVKKEIAKIGFEVVG
jgi:copper chaperone